MVFICFHMRSYGFYMFSLVFMCFILCLHVLVKFLDVDAYVVIILISFCFVLYACLVVICFSIAFICFCIACVWFYTFLYCFYLFPHGFVLSLHRATSSSVTLQSLCN